MTGPRRGTEEDWARAKLLWDDDIPVAVIARTIGFNASAVYQQSRHRGWRRRPHIRTDSPSPSDWAEARVMWDRAEPALLIAEFLHRTVSAVYRHGWEHHWPRRKHGGPRPPARRTTPAPARKPAPRPRPVPQLVEAWKPEAPPPPPEPLQRCAPPPGHIEHACGHQRDARYGPGRFSTEPCRGCERIPEHLIVATRLGTFGERRAA